MHDVGVHSINLGRKRPGVCHRCGWRGSVGKLHWRSRRALKADRSFDRLCWHCATELVSGYTAATDTREHAVLRVVSDRVVA